MIEYVAERSYRENEEASGSKGGRIVDQHIGTFIRMKAIDLMTANKKDFELVLTIRICMKSANDTQAKIESVRDAVDEGSVIHA